MRKVNWGILGTAGIAESCTIPGMQQAESCRLYAVAGRDPEKAERFRQKFGFEKAYGSYEALLADPEVEAVYIPLPNDLHHEWTLKALRAKKHVLCEKPLAPTAAQAEEMIRTAEENGVFLMEAFAYLHSPYTLAIKEELERGTIGELLYMESAFITSDYDLRNIRMRRDTFGGCSYDLGCYGISQILWMFDEEPIDVQAIAEFSAEGVDIHTSGLLRFAGGRRAAFQCGMVLATERDRRIDRCQIHGSQGSIVAEAAFNQDGELSYRICTDAGETIRQITVPQNYGLEVEQLCRCITAGEQPHVSNAFTLRTARVLDRVLEAIGY